MGERDADGAVSGNSIEDRGQRDPVNILGLAGIGPAGEFAVPSRAVDAAVDQATSKPTIRESHSEREV